MRIGIDFDNTLVCYDDAFIRVGAQESLLPAGFPGKNKTDVRHYVRQLENGEYQWQRLQGLVYGRLIMEAKLFDGVADFFTRATAVHGVELYIVSHKTELAHHDPLQTNLRDAAMGFLEAHGFFGKLRLPRAHVFFNTTREEKIARIAALRCDAFIDDLPEVLTDPDFPPGCERLLFSETGQENLAYFADWAAITRHLLS